MPANRTDDRTDAPRIESHTLARAGHQAPHATQHNGRHTAARPGREERQKRSERTPDRPRAAARQTVQQNNRSRAGGSLQDVLQKHRREMKLAAVSHQRAGTGSIATEAEVAPRPRKATPPREEYKRNPKDPRSPNRPSITTLVQSQGYGPQNFGRDDVIDKPRRKPEPGGGANLPMPATAPPRAVGTDTGQSRSAPAMDRR